MREHASIRLASANARWRRSLNPVHAMHKMQPHLQRIHLTINFYAVNRWLVRITFWKGNKRAIERVSKKNQNKKQRIHNTLQNPFIHGFLRRNEVAIKVE